MAERCYTECRYAECRYVECRDATFKSLRLGKLDPYFQILDSDGYVCQ